MARDIETIERRVGANPIQLPSISAGQQLINALSGFSKTIAGITEADATEKAAIQGMLAREGDKEVNLAPGVTRPTAAFNQAYRNADARILTRTGIDLIADAAVKANNPATLNSNSVQNFESTVAGIVEGTLSQALPETRGSIEESLLSAASRAKVKTQRNVQNFENNRMLQTFNTDYNNLKEDRYAALLSKDDERVAQIDEEIATLFQDWSMLNTTIEASVPSLVGELAESERKARWLGDFLEAQEAGKGDEYLNTFVQSEIKDLRAQDKLDLIGQMNKINNVTSAAQSGSQALSMEQLKTDIDNPLSPTHISTQEELEAAPQWQNITPLQKQQISHKLVITNNQNLRKGDKFANALNDIANGRAAFVDKKTVNDMFTARLKQVETQGRASLLDQFNLVQELNTNVPKFDALVSNMLTTGDVDTALTAGNLYATASLAEKENLIKLTGDAATVAEKLRTQFNFTANPTEDTVKGILKQVLQRDEPQVIERLDAANKSFAANGRNFYKDVMGVEPDPFTDQGAFAVFKDAFTSAMIRGNTADEASRVAKNAMKAWGTDEWAVEDNVILAPPTKMLPMSAGNYNIRNQLLTQFNDIKNAFNAQITPEAGLLPMKFVDKFEMPKDRVSDTDFVYSAFDKITIPGEVTDIFNPGPMEIVPSGIKVEVDGVASELKILSSPQTLATPAEGLVYGLFAKDKFGVYQQLQDPRSEDGLGYVVLNDVDVTAPGVTGEEADARMVKSMEDALLQQRIQELKETYLSSEFKIMTPGLRAQVQARMERLFKKEEEKETVEEIANILTKGRTKEIQKDLERLGTKKQEGES